MARLLQNGFWAGSVLPAMMSVMMKAACGLTTSLPCGAGPAGGQIFCPFESRTSRIVVRGMSTPPFAMAP